MRLELEKRVTEITYNERDSTAEVYTHNAYMRTRLEKLAYERPEECRIIEYVNEGRGIRCTVPKEWIRLYLGAGRTLKLSKADRQAKADRLRAYNQNRRKHDNI